MTVPAYPYQLASLAAVKAWIGTTASTGDNDLARLLAAASRFVLSYLSRGNILSVQYTDRMDAWGYGQDRIMLKRWPVTSLASLSIGSTAIPLATPPGPGAACPNGALLSPWDGIPPGNLQWIDLYNYCLPRTRQQVVATYQAGYLTSGEPHSVPVTPGPYTLTTDTFAQPYGAWASDGGVSYANGTPLTKIASGVPTVGQYSVGAPDTTTLIATYTFAAADQGAAILISYSYVPLDLAQATIEVTALRAVDKTHLGQSSKSLGGQETITYKDVVSAEVESMLQNYRHVVPM